MMFGFAINTASIYEGEHEEQQEQKEQEEHCSQERETIGLALTEKPPLLARAFLVLDVLLFRAWDEPEPAGSGAGPSACLRRGP